MRKPLSPLEALGADTAGAAARQIDLDSVLSDWVAAAQLSCDLAAAHGAIAEHPPALDGLLEREALLTAIASRPTMVNDGKAAPSNSISVIAERLRVHAEAMEQHGCFELALTTVSAVCRLTARNDPAGNALATLHLGRIARQMNALDAAEDAYDTAIGRALHLREPPIAARGYIGLALIADMRGNLPLSAQHYREAMRLSEPSHGVHLQALQGLMSHAVTRNELGEALVLGWTIYDRSANDVFARNQSLIELSVIALRAGFPAQARAGFKVLLDGQLPPRNRLVALGGDVRAAALLGQSSEVDRLTDAIKAEAALSNALQESTMTYLHLAEAFHVIGNDDAAESTLERARQMADQFGFNEYSFAADTLEHSWRSSDSKRHMPSSTWTADSEEITLAIERFTTLV